MGPTRSQLSPHRLIPTFLHPVVASFFPFLGSLRSFPLKRPLPCFFFPLVDFPFSGGFPLSQKPGTVCFVLTFALHRWPAGLFPLPILAPWVVFPEQHPPPSSLKVFLFSFPTPSFGLAKD